VAVGGPSRNLAITHADFSDAEAFAAVRSFSDAPVLARVALRIIGPGRREIARASVRLAPLGRAAMVLAPRGADAAEMAGAAAVELSVGHELDDLGADDLARAARTSGRVRRVGVVGEPGGPLTRALWASRVEIVSLGDGDGAPRRIGSAEGPDAAAAEALAEADLDALVYVGRAPAKWPPALPAIIVAPDHDAGPVTILDDELRDVTAFVVGTDREMGLTQGFPPVEFGVRRAKRARITTAHLPLVSAGGDLLAAQFSAAGRTCVYLGFRPEESEWPERESFPVFIALAIGAMRSRAEAKGRLTFARVGDEPGEHLPPDVAAVRLPGGREVPRGGRLLVSGLYLAGQTPLAVNLVSERESDNRVAPEETARPVGVEATALAGRIDETDLAGVLAALGVALLAAEWLVSARRS
jgi:hypothetical protein